MANIDKDNGSNNNDSDQIDSLLNSSEFKVKLDEFNDILSKLSKLIKEVGSWSESTAKLFLLELSRNFTVTYKILFCLILFIPLLIIFILSLCAFSAIVVYSFYSNIVIASGIFLTSLFIVLLLLAYWQKKLSVFLGFEETVSQIKEGLDVITNATKQGD